MNNILKTPEYGMEKISEIFKVIDLFAFSFLGVTVLEMIPLMSFSFLDNLDGIVKSIMTFAGMLYFVISIPHKIKMQNLEKKIKQEELEVLEFDNDQNKKK